MKRDHVLTTSLNPWTLNHLIVDLPSPTSFRKSYLFHPLNLEACSLHLIEWDRIDIVERWIDTDQSLHLDTDQKTIRDNLRRTNFDWWFTLCWVSIDHFYSWWNQRSSSEIFLIFDSDFYLYQSTLAALQLESGLNSSDLFFWTSLNQIRAASQSEQSPISASHQILAKIASQSEQSRSPHIQQALKLVQWRQILNHRIDQKNDES